jgi:diguanylate cyclase (GGDEF)-like protein
VGEVSSALTTGSITKVSWMSARPFIALLVSSDRVLLRRLTKFLDVFGFEVRQAVGMAQAADVAEASSVDFLLVDGTCPLRDSAQLCRTVRKLSDAPFVYALLLLQDRDIPTLTDAMEAGFDDFLVQPVVYGELLARLRAGSRVVEFERRLGEQLGYDSTTGLLDKLSLRMRFDARLADVAADPFALALLDLDSFQRVNRRLGEAAGTTLLKSVAQWLEEQVVDGETLAVVQPNRFGLLLPAGSAAERGRALLAALAEQPFTVCGQELRLTASAGLVLVEAKEDFQHIKQRAEKALELAKASGRNCLATSDEVDEEIEAWAEAAAAGRLFETTLARDVMIPCPLLLTPEESLDQAFGLLDQTQLGAAPVVDSEGRLLGIVTREQLESRVPRSGRPQSSSIRLVRHVMTTDAPTFEEITSLTHLMEFLSIEGHELAVVVRDGKPLGTVTCQGLAALNDRLATDRFVPCGTATAESAYLVVADLPMAEAN